MNGSRQMRLTINDDDDSPPVLLVIALGWSASLPGSSLVRELSRLTEIICLPIPCDEAMTEEAMQELERRASESEVPVLCVYDATVGEDDLCGKPNSRLREWGADVARVLGAADASNHEVVFVFDRSHDGHTKSLGHHEPLRTAKGTSDAFSVLPEGLEAYILPFMRSRPVILRSPLARFNAAQVLNLIVAALPEPPSAQQVADADQRAAQATAAKQQHRDNNQFGGSPAHRNRAGRGGTAAAAARKGGHKRNSLSGGGGGPGGAAAVVGLSPEFERARQRACLVLKHFKDLVFLRPSPNDLPYDPLQAVGLKFNAALIGSEPEQGAVCSAVQLQLCRHYATADCYGDPSLAMASLLDSCRASAYVVNVLSARLLTDPWALHLIDFAERTRGENHEENYEKIWIRDATLPPCSMDDDNDDDDDDSDSNGGDCGGDGGGDGQGRVVDRGNDDEGGSSGGGHDNKHVKQHSPPSSNKATGSFSAKQHRKVAQEAEAEAAWKEVVEPLLEVGLKRLAASGWAPAPQLPPPHPPANQAILVGQLHRLPHSTYTGGGGGDGDSHSSSSSSSHPWYQRHSSNPKDSALKGKAAHTSSISFSEAFSNKFADGEVPKDGAAAGDGKDVEEEGGGDGHSSVSGSGGGEGADGDTISLAVDTVAEAEATARQRREVVLAARQAGTLEFFAGGERVRRRRSATTDFDGRISKDGSSSGNDDAGGGGGGGDSVFGGGGDADADDDDDDDHDPAAWLALNHEETTTMHPGEAAVLKQRFQEEQEAVRKRAERLRKAIRSGLGLAVPFTQAIGLGGGMEVREMLGPSLQACSVVLNHTPGNATALTRHSDFFYQRLVTLDLSGRPLTLVAVSHLADAMDHNRSLNEMWLDRASLPDNAVVAICEAMIRDADPDVHTLSLRHNCIGAAGAFALARSLELNGSLTSIDLKPNPCHYDLEANKRLASSVFGNKVLQEVNGLKLGFSQEYVDRLLATSASPPPPTNQSDRDGHNEEGPGANNNNNNNNEDDDVHEDDGEDDGGGGEEDSLLLALPSDSAAGDVAASGKNKGGGGGEQEEEKRGDVEEKDEKQRLRLRKKQKKKKKRVLDQGVLVAELLSGSHAREGLSMYEVAFVARRLQLDPPAIPQALLERVELEWGEELKLSKRSLQQASRGSSRRAGRKEEGQGGQDHEEEDNEEVLAAAAAAAAAASTDTTTDGGGGGQEDDDFWVNMAMAEGEKATAVEGMSSPPPPPTPLPPVVVALSLVGRSLGVADAKVLSRGVGVSSHLAALDLRHNPFEDEEDDYDAVVDIRFTAAFNRPKPPPPGPGELGGLEGGRGEKDSVERAAQERQKAEEEMAAAREAAAQEGLVLGANGEPLPKGHPLAAAGAGGRAFPLQYPPAVLQAVRTTSVGAGSRNGSRSDGGGGGNMSRGGSVSRGSGFDVGGRDGGGDFDTGGLSRDGVDTSGGGGCGGGVGGVGGCGGGSVSGAARAAQGESSPLEDSLWVSLRHNTSLGELNGLRLNQQTEEFTVSRTPKALKSYEVQWLAGKLMHFGSASSNSENDDDDEDDVNNKRSVGVGGRSSSSSRRLASFSAPPPPEPVPFPSLGLAAAGSGKGGSLKSLNLTKTGLSTRRLLAIVETLKHCPFLEEVDFRHNPSVGGHAIADALVDAVATHPTRRLSTVSGMPIRAIIGGPWIDDDREKGMGGGGVGRGRKSSLFLSGSSRDGKSFEMGSGELLPQVSGDEVGTTMLQKGSGGSDGGGGGGGSGPQHQHSQQQQKKTLRSLKLDYCELGPSELVMLCIALRFNALLPSPVRSLDLSMNQICGVDKLGQGHWCRDGLEALTNMLPCHKGLRSVSLYLNFCGPKAVSHVKRLLAASHKSFKVLNLQFTDVCTIRMDNGGGSKETPGGGGSGNNDASPQHRKTLDGALEVVQQSDSQGGGGDRGDGKGTASPAEQEIRQAALDNGVSLEM